MAQPITLEHVFDLSVAVASPFELGEIGLGERRIIAIDGGLASGPRLKGRILPGGADFQIIRPNADDGALIYLENNGIRFGSLEDIARLKRGEPVPPERIYFKAVPRFETSAPAYRWMMEAIFLCTGIRKPASVELSVYRVG
jgi:Protein of unknown function (DUF3237)